MYSNPEASLLQRYRNRSKTDAEVSGNFTMKPVFLILHKKHRKYSSARSPFLSGWRKTGHVQMIYKHGSPKGVTKVNRWRTHTSSGRQSTPTQYTIPKREKYIKPEKNIDILDRRKRQPATKSSVCELCGSRWPANQ